jgi:hypothetical protein
MTEEQKATDEIPAEEQAGSGVILEELQEAGQQLYMAFKSLWESDESRKMRQEINSGFTELGQQLGTAVNTAQESDAAKKIEEGVVTGLRALNQELSRFLNTMEPKAEAEDEPEAEAEA